MPPFWARSVRPRVIFAQRRQIEDFLVNPKSHKSEGSRGAQIPKPHTHAELCPYLPKAVKFVRAQNPKIPMTSGLSEQSSLIVVCRVEWISCLPYHPTGVDMLRVLKCGALLMPPPTHTPHPPRLPHHPEIAYRCVQNRVRPRMGFFVTRPSKPNKSIKHAPW